MAFSPDHGASTVHALTGSQRRMLLEMLAAEGSGESAIDVARFGRERVAQQLCHLTLANWAASSQITLTQYGRYLADLLAERLVRDNPQMAC